MSYTMTRDKYERAMRSLTSPTASPFNGVYSLEDLEKRALITTPKDTPLFNTLRSRATKAMSYMFEWTEVTLESDLTHGKYDGFTLPAGVTSAAARDQNYLMAVCSIPKVSRFTQVLDSVDGNAMILETKQKFLNLVRQVEYFLWNGDHASNPDETNGVCTLVTAAIDNVSGVLQEVKLQEAVVAILEDGGIPSHVFCPVNVAYAIARFSSDRIRYDQNISGGQGIGRAAFTYITPYGYDLTVVPVLTEFIGTGNVYVLDMEQVELKYVDQNVLNVSPIPIVQHGESKIMYSFFGLKLKAKNKYHRVISNVANAIKN